MARWPWIERRFNLDFPPGKFPDLLERLRGTPPRLHHLLEGVPPEVLTRRDGSGWSIQENVGHLVDLGYLPRRRIEQILAGEPELIAADMTNRRTQQANHNAAEFATLLATFERERGQLVDILEQLPEESWGLSAVHPRLQQPMRIVDIVYFDSEHDDYHLARVRELLRAFEA